MLHLSAADLLLKNTVLTVRRNVISNQPANTGFCKFHLLPPKQSRKFNSLFCPLLPLYHISFFFSTLSPVYRAQDWLLWKMCHSQSMFSAQKRSPSEFKLKLSAHPHALLRNILDPLKYNPLLHLLPRRPVVAFPTLRAQSHQKHFLRSFLTRALVLGRLEDAGAGVGLVRVGAGTSYSPSRASITPWKRPSCCLKSCSTLEEREKQRRQLKRKETKMSEKHYKHDLETELM